MFPPSPSQNEQDLDQLASSITRAAAKNPQLLRDAAVVWRAAGNLDLARHYAAHDDPVAADFYYSFAMTPGIKPFVTKSEAILFDLSRPAPSIIREYADFLFDKEDLDGAMRLYDSWIDRGQTTFLLDQAMLYRKAGDPKRAGAKLERAIEVLVPGSFEALGSLLGESGQHARAADAFRKAFNTGLSRNQSDVKALAVQAQDLAAGTIGLA